MGANSFLKELYVNAAACDCSCPGKVLFSNIQWGKYKYNKISCWRWPLNFLWQGWRKEGGGIIKKSKNTFLVSETQSKRSSWCNSHLSKRPWETHKNQSWNTWIIHEKWHKLEIKLLISFVVVVHFKITWIPGKFLHHDKPHCKQLLILRRKKPLYVSPEQKH